MKSEISPTVIIFVVSFALWNALAFINIYFANNLK